ncbi:MAG TPA: pyridoxal phosphate-dependent aminotransferase family protein [Candidatus Acidoferrum sp.]|jgi:8-amino-7-oxononanoate synthase|nr:pyridoxal phosphate-dependent aminotransferase family protein [Candidatus Acidoferrum sp.]
MTEPAPLQQIDRTYVRFRGRKLSYFSGCDYFRLSSRPGVIAALQAGARRFGLNVAASRLTTGNHALYGELERRLARFFGAPDALLVSSGYLTNLVVAQALAGNFSHALLDDQSHPSLADAARFLECPVLRFRHLDPDSVAASVRRCGPGASLLLLTDGMFSHNGSVAPLAAYLKALPRDGVMLVDDAHAAGVLGKRGRGSLEHDGVSRSRIIQTITLSKAFGAFGGAILGTAALRRRIIDRSPMLIGSTPPPLPLANAALRAVRILSSDKRLRFRLAHNANYLKNALRAAGLLVADTPGPLVALVPERPQQAARLKAALLAAGIFPPFIKYPGGPAQGYFRFVISSEHTRRQLDRLIRVLAKAAARFSPR